MAATLTTSTGAAAVAGSFRSLLFGTVSLAVCTTAAGLAGIAIDVPAAHAAQVTTIGSFTGTNGSAPFSGVIMDAAGDLFGTTLGGGTAGGGGTVFELSKTVGGYAAPMTLANFSHTNGSPAGGLVADAAGDLFGTTTGGGVNHVGSVFEIAKNGSSYEPLTTLASFSGANGIAPAASLLIDSAGDLIGTTGLGGASSAGTVFEITKTGSSYASTPTTLANFNGPNGANPQAGLIADAAGDLFGTTSKGGTATHGTVFEIPKSVSGYGPLTPLVSFTGGNGSSPFAALLADAAGDLFGTTNMGGTSGDGTVFEIPDTGGIYAGTPTILANFNGTNGMYPNGGLIADPEGDLFGTSSGGGGNGGGTVFKIAKTGGGYGPLSTLVNFNGTDGLGPAGTLIADPNQNLFGTTLLGGGPGGLGTVFETSETTVPEPASLGVLASGLMGLVLGRRRKRA